MDSTERERIQKIIPSHRELRVLYEEHLDLEEQLAWFERRNFLTPTEEMKVKLLKRRKLLGVERMLDLVGRVQDHQMHFDEAAEAKAA